MPDQIIDELISFLKNKPQTVKGLLVGFLIAALFIESFGRLLYPSFGESQYKYLVHILGSICWFIVWLHIRFSLPKNKKNKLGLCFLIYNENKLEEFKFKRDFLSHLKNIITEMGLHKSVNFIEVKSHFSEKLQQTNGEKEKVATIKKWNKKMRCQFLIWGDVRRRGGENGMLILKLDSMVYHVELPPQVKEKLRKDMLTVFPKDIRFFEKYEFQGFQFAAEQIALATEFIIGTAAFLSGDVSLASKLHKNVLALLDGFQTLPPHLIVIKKTTKEMVSDEFVITGRYYYRVEKNLDKMIEFINRSLEFNPKNYLSFLLFSIYLFKKRDIAGAIEKIEVARKYSNGDLAWAYSEAFLYCYSGDLKKADEYYRRAFEAELSEPEVFLRDIISFIEETLKEEPDKKQLYFALGKIYYYCGNLPESCENYKKFIEDASIKSKFPHEAGLAERYIDKAEKEMGLSN